MSVTTTIVRRDIRRAYCDATPAASVGTAPPCWHADKFRIRSGDTAIRSPETNGRQTTSPFFTIVAVALVAASTATSAPSLAARASARPSITIRVSDSGITSLRRVPAYVLGCFLPDEHGMLHVAMGMVAGFEVP